RHEYAGAFRIAHPPHPRISIEHAGRIIDAADARQDVLVEILLQINSVAGEHGRAALGQTDDHHLAAGRVRDGAVDFDAVIAEQVEIAIELDGLVFGRHAAADAVAQHGEVTGDEERGEAIGGPEVVLDLVALIDKGRIEELADIAGMVDVEMPEYDIFDVGRLHVDLGELGIDGDVGRAARIERFDERAPIIRIGDDLVVVAAIKQHVALGMPDQVKTDRDLYLAARTVLNNRFVEVQRTGAEHIKLHFFWRIRRDGGGGRYCGGGQCQSAETLRPTYRHFVLPIAFP